MRFPALLPLLALSLTAQAPAGKAPAAKTSARKGAPAKAGAAPAPASASSSPVLAKVGGEPITEADVEAMLSTMPAQQRMQLQYMPNGRQELVRRMAESKLLSIQAKKLGMDKSDTFQRLLARTKDDLLAREFLMKEGPALQKKMEVNDEQVKAFFEGHKAQFRKPLTYDARHILIGKRPTGAEKDRTEEEINARVKEVQAELASGKPFESLVEKYSDDPGKSQDPKEPGLYKGVQEKQFVPEFEQAALTQELGKVGAPVKSQFGVHIIRAEARTPAVDQPFEAVKDQAKDAALKERQTQVWEELLASLRKGIAFEITPPAAAQPAANVTPTKANGASK